MIEGGADIVVVEIFSHFFGLLPAVYIHDCRTAERSYDMCSLFELVVGCPDDIRYVFPHEAHAEYVLFLEVELLLYVVDGG